VSARTRRADRRRGVTFSRDGQFLTLLQRNFGATPAVRVFDLGTKQRTNELERLRNDLPALQKEACRVAAFEPGGNRMTEQELRVYLRNPQAKQPCDDR